MQSNSETIDQFFSKIILLFNEFGIQLSIIVLHLFYMKMTFYFGLKWCIKTKKLTEKILTVLWKKLSLFCGMYKFIKIK